MSSSRLLVLATALGALTACSDSGTLPEMAPSTGHGALIVQREELLPGGRPQRRTAIDPETGATLAPVPWFPAESDGRRLVFATAVTFSRDGQWMAWIEVASDTTINWTCYYAYDGGCGPNDARQRLFTARVGSSEKTLLTPEYFADRAPAFSPDGRRVVVLRSDSDLNEAMVTVARDGSDTKTVLFETRRRRGAPDWSPSGTQILYQRPDLGSLYQVQPDGTNPRSITTGTAVYGTPTWSPDGRRIAVPVRDDPRSYGDQSVWLAILGVDGAEYVRVPAIGEWAWGQKMAWSPDASRIAYCAMEYGPEGHWARTVVRVATLATGVIRTITPAGFTDCNPIWRP